MNVHRFLRNTFSVRTLVLITIALLTTAGAQVYEVSGALVDQQEDPVAHVTVHLYGEDRKLLDSTETDADGSFTLSYELAPVSAEVEADQPADFQLGASYPNPFNPRTTFPFEAPQEASVSISIHDVLGRSVMQTQTGVLKGHNEIHVNLGGRLAQGQYVMRVQGKNFSTSGLMTFVSAGISSGNPGITVQSGGTLSHPTARIAEKSDIPRVTDDSKLELHIKGRDDVEEKVLPVPLSQDHHVGFVTVQVTKSRNTDAVKVIVDTDMHGDCDDAGALALLHSLANKGEAEILAVLVNNLGEYSAGAVAAYNAYFGRPDIPVGAYMGDAVGGDTGWYYEQIAKDTKRYGHDKIRRDQFPDATEVYRKTLAAAEDGEVVMISIGHLNNLYYLLQSGPDDYSPLSGVELIKAKVDHIVIMGGTYPAGGDYEAGKEHNFRRRGAAAYTGDVIAQWPTRILLSGFEIGENIMTGSILEGFDKYNPVRIAYDGYLGGVKDHHSWDQSAMLAAIRDPETYWELSKPGWCRVDHSGKNYFSYESDGMHNYLIERKKPGPQDVAEIINQLMLDLR